MATSERVIRAPSGIALTILAWALCAVAIASTFAIGVAIAPLVLAATAGWFAWLIFWRPSVVLSEDHLEFRNLLRDVSIPYPTIEDVDTRYTLRVTSGGRRYVAWAAPAPGPRRAIRQSDGRPGSRPGDDPQSLSGDIATAIEGARRLVPPDTGASATVRIVPWLTVVSATLLVASILAIVLLR